MTPKPLQRSTSVRELRFGPALLALAALRLGLHVTEDERKGRKGQAAMELGPRKGK